MKKKPPARNATKGILPHSAIALANFKKADSRGVSPMNFKVAEAFHREFKLYAVQRGMTMVDLLQESFQALKDQRGA